MIQMLYSDNGIHVNLARAPQVTNLQLQKWMDRTVKYVAAAVQKNIGRSGLIGRRTGNLARAIRSVVTVTGLGQVVGTVWPDRDIVPYGDIHEDGGTIVPKTARSLAIPLAAMLTPNGVARGTAAQLRQNPQAFGYRGTFAAKGVIFGTQMGGRSIVPLFALKPSVVIPARHYMATTLTQSIVWMQDELERLTGEAVTLIFGEAAA